MSDIHVRIYVKMSASIWAGITVDETDRLTRESIAGLVQDNIDAAGGIEGLIDSWTIEEVCDSSDRTLVSTEHGVEELQ